MGADEVAFLRAPWLEAGQPDAWVAALEESCARLQPDVLILAHITMGREVGPRLAARLAVPIVTDCTEVRMDGDSGALVGVRPCFSGKALSEIALAPGSLRIATLRRASGSATVSAANPAPAPSVTLELSAAHAGHTRVLERVVPPPGALRLEDASIVVGVGRGVATAEAFRSYIVEGLAKTLGAAVGGSRGAVDMGIIPAELQIGLTGRVVSPSVYVAIGLSGSPQHMAGCGGASTIVAINTDPQAPIFAYARHGVVGDFRKVVPSLTERLAKILAEDA
ncbi:MAG: electron transfer flavoprotein subunit alpha/FixB family protein [Dehalococcoidia bacterium]|nr:electron transfer flavoprotein subunit alpha/FixB family protein [Dehalococcoidia bacterium]